MESLFTIEKPQSQTKPIENKLKICALSDLHGTLLSVEDIEPCELVCISGDIVPLNIQANSHKTKSWLRNKFKPWCESLPCDKVVFIAGNHDRYLQDLNFMYSVFPKDGKVTYLFHEGYTYTSKDGKEYSIFGTPYCKIFGNWAFMESNEILIKLYEDIPENLDILISHDAPFGISDIILQEDCSWYDGKTHLGNEPLSAAILKRAPKIVLHGHLHSTSREFEEWGHSKVINCSIKDEHYNPVYDPIVFEL